MTKLSAIIELNKLSPPSNSVVGKGGCRFYFIFLILILITSACSKKQNPIVAQFGRYTITLDEFRIAYLEVLKQPKVLDSRETRERFLDELINRKLLADAARLEKLDTDERFHYQVEAYQNKCLRDEHYQRIIEPKVKFDDDLLQQTFLFTQEQRRIKHLFFETKAQADSAYNLLQQGKASFDELAKIIFKDSTLANSGGDLGWVDWDQMEYDLANAAFHAQINSISPPVRSTHGYHILKVVDWKKNPLISENEYQQQRDNTANVLKLKIGQKIADDYIDRMMKKTKVKVRSDALRFVGEKLERLLTKLPTDSASIDLTAEEIESVQASLWDIRREPMIFIDDETITIGQFIAQLSYIPRSAMKMSFKTVLDFAIRDFKLTQEARAMGLASTSETVQMKTALFEEYRLQMMLRKKLIDDIQITDADIKQKFEELNMGKKFDASPDEYHEVIERNLLMDRKSTEVPNFIRKLRGGLIIQTNVQVIHDYFDSIIKK
ncbi:MAG: peptidylprolyl isomerase [bacterium]|nr:peptidylprolyl isomerase [bacterium]